MPIVYTLIPKSRATSAALSGFTCPELLTPSVTRITARDLGIKVYTIGIGGIAEGQDQGTREYDEATLREVARITSGTYLNAATVEGLEAVYAEIERLERVASDDPEARVIEELFAPFLLAALLLYATHVALSRSVFRRIP